MCPDYKYGAMENVGCITYSDGIMCSKKEMSIPELTFFCVVIQHELAHMWFGNLVTMQWWTDLWLNESFATAMSYLVCSEGGKFVEEFKDESWLHFTNYKRWGLIEDLGPTNHNIEATCESTDVSESLIDGITYGKGACLLKQLIFLMGLDAFSMGLKHYFRQYEWKNTSLQNFIDSLQEGYNHVHGEKGDLNLNLWAEKWLRTKGPNSVQIAYESEGGKITKFTLKQGLTDNGDEVLRKQCFNIALVKSDMTFTEIERVVLEAQAETDVPQMVGQDLPDAFLLNSNDYGFALFIIDDRSIEVFENNMGKLKHQLNKAVLLSQFITMMREIRYPATRMPLILNQVNPKFNHQIMDEENQNLIQIMYNALFQARVSYLPAEKVPAFVSPINLSLLF